MAIKVNVISENTTFTVENANYCTVALPITACWGPGFTLPTAAPALSDIDSALENTAWSLFTADPEGLEAFIATYRGPSSNYRSTKDYSYFAALSLLNSGYAIQTCRLCPGTAAQVSIPTSETSPVGTVIVRAKYPGTFGNNLRVTLKKKGSGTSAYWNLIGYAVDSNGTSRAVENLVFVFEPEHSTDTIVTIDELQSKFFTFQVDGNITDNLDFGVVAQPLTGGSDVASAADQTAQAIMTEAINLANLRYSAPPLEQTDTFTGDGETKEFDFSKRAITVTSVKIGDVVQPATAYTYSLDSITFTTAPADDSEITVTYSTSDSDYIVALMGVKDVVSKSTAESIRFNEWIYTFATGYMASGSAVDGVYDLLRDKINYNPNRIISPWDDQDILNINPDYPITDMAVSPMHSKLMDVANDSRCATAYIDVPRSLPRGRVWDDTDGHLGYAQRLSSVQPAINDPLYPSSSALFAPWGQYMYAGTTKQALATPSFMALLIERAMIKNQSAQYEWALPTTRNNNVKLGQLAYTVPKKLLDDWQAPDGTRVNTITTVPSLGTTIWGNATLFDVPVATYQALMNLSTRKLINAVKDTVFKIGIGMEFQYNGQEAYAKFFAGITPLLDTMRNVGAILDYKVKMAADINNLDSINANSVVGTVYLVIAGVIENITVDLIALPQGTDLSQF